MKHVSFPVTEIKALNGADEPGTFEAIVSVFGNVDRGGDRMQRGAFKRTLKERGMPPIVWSHDWNTPPIGVTTEAVENNEGLRIKGRLFIDDHDVARQVYAGMKAGALREFSFGYDPQNHETVTEDGKDIRVIKDVDLFEVGPTLVGMNPSTRLIGVKNAEQEQEEEQDDKPDPKPLGEEEKARIRALLAQHPQHARSSNDEERQSQG